MILGVGKEARSIHTSYDLRWRSMYGARYGARYGFKDVGFSIHHGRYETLRSQLVRCSIIIFIAIALTVSTTRSRVGQRIQKECSLDLERLSHFNLTSTFKYTRNDVGLASDVTNTVLDGEYDDGNNQPRILALDQAPSPVLIDVTTTTKRKIDTQCDRTPLQLSVRQAQDHQAGPFAEHILFGVASTAERLLEASDHLGHWLGGSGARLTVVAPDSHLLPWLKYELERRDVKVSIIISDEPTFLSSYFRLVQWLNKTKTAKTQWITFIDDDTFFFSMHRFVNMLRKYDEREDHYIGAVSEDGWQMMRSGEFAFGGAGITLSVSLLDKLQPFYEHCKTYKHVDPTAPEMGGDLRLARCITRNTPVKLSREVDLHQVDLRGNVRGLIQGPRVPITWHHYKSHMWGSLNILTHARSVPFCPGNSCLFQRFKFYDSADNVSVLHLGHSVARYAAGIDPQMDMYEATWTRRPLSTYDHSLEPLRRAYVEGEEIFTYTLEHGQWLADGSYAQTYVRRANATKKNEVDDVIEYIWKL